MRVSYTLPMTLSRTHRPGRLRAQDEDVSPHSVHAGELPPPLPGVALARVCGRQRDTEPVCFRDGDWFLVTN
jgi:hypothetical protein